MSEWQTSTLGECADWLSGGTPFKGNPAFWSGTIPWVSAKDMKSFRLHDAEDHISAEAVGRGGKLVPSGTVLLLVRGMTLHNDVPICVTMREMAFNQDIKAIRAKPGLEHQFLAYWLLANKPALLSAVDHAGHGTGRLMTDLLKQMSVQLPSLPEQRAVAAVLGALDDKIELNRRMNETLEALAQSLFKPWFVDATQSALPKGWREGSILEVAKLLSGGTPKTEREDYWNGDILWASARDVSQCGQTFLVTTERTITKKGLEESATQLIPAFCTVVVARGATTGRMTMFGREIAMNQTCYALASTTGTPFALYCLFRHAIDALVQTAHGSVFDTITTSTFAASKVVLPPQQVFDAFEKTVSPIFARILSNIEESRTLAALRDALLPKLLSGELRVPAAAKPVEGRV